MAVSVSSLYSGLLSGSFQGRNDACPPQDLFIEGLREKKPKSITTDHHLYQQSRPLLFLFIIDHFPAGVTFVLFALTMTDVVPFLLALRLVGN